MSITYERNYPDSRDLISLRIVGDGSTTSFTVPLQAGPILNQNSPTGVPSGTFVIGGSATLSLSAGKDKVTITFSVAPSAGSITNLDFVLLYDGV